MKLAVATLIVLVVIAPPGLAAAREKADAPNQPAAKDPAATEQPLAAAAAEVDPFQISNGSPEEILDFIAGLKKLKPSERTRPALLEHAKKVLLTSLQAADKVVASKPDPAIEARAQHVRIETLWAVPRVAGPSAFNAVVEECRKLTHHKRPDVAVDAKVAELGARLIWAQADESAEPKELVDQLADLIAAGPLDNFSANVAVLVANRFVHGFDQELTVHTCRKLADALDKHHNENVSEFVGRLRGTAERLALMGNPIDISGVTASGKPFDWASYKGKVVLIDFWATWCGPCLAELPNVKKTYEKYHNRGFDVVGVNLDQDRDRLDKFMGSEKLAWTMLVGPSPEKSGWKHPLATHYGIDAIPAMILVDRKGNVVSLEARGETLQKLVAELLDEKAEE